MGRRNKKLAKIQQAQQAREFLKNKEKPLSLISLPSDSKRVEIAHVCTVILSNPELQYNKIETILELCYDTDPYIQALAISSLCAVFIDILPGYKIVTHEEEKVELSKETKAIRIYETDLLKLYEKFIEILESKNNKGCVRCACRLLKGLSHFNFRERLLSLAIKNVTEASDIVVEMLPSILNCNDFEFKLYIVKAIEKFIKSSSFKIVPYRIIEILSELEFKTLVSDNLPKKRNRDEEEKQNDSELIYNQKTLREILSIYFLIIKKHYNTELMIPALKGVVKYSGILNIEIVLDLVKNLIKLLKESQVKGKNCFHCIFACIRLISGTQNVIRLEDKDLTLVLYAAILSPPVDKPSQKIMIKALWWLLVEQKQYSYELIAAFVKRIMQVAFHCELALMKAFLCLVKHIMCKFTKAYLMMEDDENTDSFLSHMTDPYLAQASTSSILPQIELMKLVTDQQVQGLLKSYTNKLSISQKPLEFLI